MKLNRINMSLASCEREKCALHFYIWEVNVYDIVFEVRLNDKSRCAHCCLSLGHLQNAENNTSRHLPYQNGYVKDRHHRIRRD